MNAELESSIHTERLQAMTDGVLAIVITILVLTFEVPEHRFEHDALIEFFAVLFHPFVAYVVSFGVVAAYWVQHASISRYVQTVDRTYVWLNILFLLPLTLLPFLTDLRATYPREYVTTLLYAGTNIACGFALLAMWRYAWRRGFVATPRVGLDRSMSARILLGIGVNGAGAVVALINPFLATPFFLLLPLLYVSHRAVDRNWATSAG